MEVSISLQILIINVHLGQTLLTGEAIDLANRKNVPFQYVIVP